MRRPVGTLTVILALTIVIGALPRPTAAAPLAQTSPGVIAATAAISKRGAPYVWGAKGPTAFDCSGLTSWAWAQAGYNIGPSTYNQAYAGTAISCTLDDLHGSATTCWAPGDLVFLKTDNGQHVAMYVGNGLFADAYNEDTGVIIHDVAPSGYYHTHFWQARRITAYTGGTVNPGTADYFTDTGIDLESIPDMLGQVSFSVSQCGECGTGALLEPQEWGDSWPSGWEALNLAVVFQKAISWLSWQIGELFRVLICWLLNIVQMLANIIAGAVNAIIAGINGIWKMIVLTWLSLRAYFYAVWEMLEWFRAGWSGLIQALGWLAPWIEFIWEMAILAAQTIGMVILMLGQLAGVVIGLIGWIGAVTLEFIIAVLSALNGAVVPPQLSDTHIVYYLVRGGLEAFRDGPVTSWLLIVLWGLCWIGFLFWASRYFSGGRE